mmetsp:Transcript_44022/g.66498  ORF Transcript_44022/g.66498 Transcript_44022/m.66498 type:complete len:95 (-) Transcript_44022:14-298(-)
MNARVGPPHPLRCKSQPPLVVMNPPSANIGPPLRKSAGAASQAQSRKQRRMEQLKAVLEVAGVLQQEVLVRVKEAKGAAAEVHQMAVQLRALLT